MPKISVLLPTIRPEGLPMPTSCLGRQTFTDFELIVSMPQAMHDKVRLADPRARLVADPPKVEGDFYGLNKAWNNLVREAKGELLVFCVDNIWFEDDALECFWKLHEEHPDWCISSWGAHYRKISKAGVPEVLWQEETRGEYMQKALGDQWDGYSIFPEYFELAFASVPRQALVGVGGFDERYDQGAGWSEKELALRLAKAGCQFKLADLGKLCVQIRNWTHPKTGDYGKNWDWAANIAHAMYAHDFQAIRSGARKRLQYL